MSVTSPASVPKRMYLVQAEIEALIQATADGEMPVRDRAMAMLLFYHGLRASELCRFRASDIDWDAFTVAVNRVKGSISTRQPINGKLYRALQRYKAIRPQSPHEEFFLSKRREPLSRKTVWYLVRQWGARAAIPFPVHPHMLRHSCGYALVNMEGGSKDARLLQDYLGHTDPRHTARYTALDASRFKGLWGL